MNFPKNAGLSALVAISLLAAADRAVAADADDGFYKGKTLTIVISTEPGNIYDYYGRLLAKFMPRYIPGNPATVVQNMPGAGGVRATNHMALVAPRDGTVIAGVHSAIPTAPLTSPQGVQFDVNTLSWIGSTTKDPFVGYVWHTAPLQTLEELKSKEISFGATSAGTGGVDYAILANVFFGFKIKLVPGYKDSTEVKLALERGEVQGTFANSWGDLKSANIAWVKEKKVRIIVQHGFQRHAELPDVPLFMDQAKTEADRQALTLMLARQEFSKPYFAPPEVPAARLAILRRAFDSVMKDPEYLKEAHAANMATDNPMNGEELAATVAKVAATPPAVVERVQKTITNYQMGK